jgi:hypothetical protein
MIFATLGCGSKSASHRQIDPDQQQVEPLPPPLLSPQAKVTSYLHLATSFLKSRRVRCEVSPVAVHKSIFSSSTARAFFWQGRFQIKASCDLGSILINPFAIVPVFHSTSHDFSAFSPTAQLILGFFAFRTVRSSASGKQLAVMG